MGNSFRDTIVPNLSDPCHVLSAQNATVVCRRLKALCNNLLITLSPPPLRHSVPGAEFAFALQYLPFMYTFAVMSCRRQVHRYSNCIGDVLRSMSHSESPNHPVQQYLTTHSAAVSFDSGLPLLLFLFPML